MTAFKEFTERLDGLKKRLTAKPYTSIPDKVWQTPTKALDRLLSVLEPYYTEPKAPTKEEIKTVKEHGVTAQIRAFIDRDRERKAFFSVAYFRQKCEQLPDRKLVQALPKGQTRIALLTTFILYHYWKAKPEHLSGLASVHEEIEEDFRNSPAAKQAAQAQALLAELRRESDFNLIVSRLHAEFPDRAGVTAFAKAVSLKIPAGKKPVHERLAAKILKSGELVRAEF